MSTLSRFWLVCVICGLGCGLVASSMMKPYENTAQANQNSTDSKTSAATQPVAATPATPLYKQSLVVSVAKPQDGQKLEDFCTDKEGRILALIGRADPNQGLMSGDGEPSVLSIAAGLLGGKKKKVPKFKPAVHIYDATGKLLSKWELGFLGQAINTAPDGTVLVGGVGRVARYDLEGKKLQEAESPQMVYINNHPDDMRERAKEQLESDRAMYTDQLAEFESQLAAIKASKAQKNKASAKSDSDTKAPNTTDPNDAQDGDTATKEADPVDYGQFNEQTLKILIGSYKQQLEQLQKKTIEEALQEVVGRAKTIHAISASSDNVFVTCPAMAGYGYGVWKTDSQFANAKEIVKSLSGCCGQMDVQCRDNELYVCENSRHRVVRFDADGKELGHFGKRDREGEGENFGGCCNPMNLCFNKAGNLFVSESNGVVKHFTPEGQFLGVAGVAKVEAGCKNSCVSVSADESRLYYIDIYGSKIIVLTRTDEQASN